MPLQLSKLQEDDIDEFGILDEEAMKDWTFARMMDTSGRPRRDFVADWVRKDWGKDDKCHWLQVRDTETGEMVAGALWRFPVQFETTKERGTVAQKNPNSDIAPKGESDNEIKTRQFWEVVEQMKKEFFDEFIGSRKHAYLHLLMTHPKHRRRGAASQLVRWGCDQADELGIICALSASSDGEMVYKKHGFEVKKAVELDLSPFGADEIELRRSMIREPSRKEGEQ